MNDQLLDLLMNKMDTIHEDMKERVGVIHKDVQSFDKKLDDHIKDDEKIARDIWLIKRVFNATWAAIIGGGGLWLGWKGIKG